MTTDNKLPEPEYIAQFISSEQYTEDQWREIRPALKVTNSTTIGEIRKWMSDKHSARIAEFIVRNLESL